MTKIVVTTEELNEVLAVRDQEGIFRLPINADLSLRRADNSFGTAYVTTDPDVDLSAVNVKYGEDNYQQKIDGVFLVSTAAQRAMNPPVGELAFFANVDGVPTREQTQGLLVRGISGVGDPTYEFNDDNESQLWFEVEFSGGEANIDILELETVFSFTDSTLNQDLVGYVTNTLHGTANVAPQSNGSYEITNHTLTVDDYYIFTWDSSYAIGLATSTSVFATVETHLATGDSLPTLNQEVEIVNLVNVHEQSLPTTNAAGLATEITTRAEADAIEAVAREAGDDAERDFVENTLHVDAIDSQSYYQFSGQPAIFAEVPAVDYGITIAMPETIEDTEALVQAETIVGDAPNKVFKLTLRFNDGANDTKEYVVTTGGHDFTISDERTSETFTLPTIEGTYVAASVHQNGTNTQRQNCFLAIGGWHGRIAQVDMAHVLDVSNGNILTGRALEVGQDYSEHIVADNNDAAIVGLVFDNQTTGSHTGINAYVLQRRNRIVRYRAATSGGLFSFRNGNSVVDRFHPSTTPNVVEDQNVPESNWLGLKMVTIQNAISGTAANGDGNRLTYAVGDKMLVAFGGAINSTSAGIPVPGIATTKNPSTFAGGSANLVLLNTGGEDPSEEYSNYSSANEADFNAHIYDMEYSNASGNWTFFFGGETVGETAIATKAAGFHGESIWNMTTISAATKAGAGGIIRSVNLGGNIAGLATDTHWWITTELGALWVNTTPWLAAGYGDNALLQAHVNANDPTSDTKRDFTFRGFQYYDQHGSIGAGDDGHIYRLVINPEITFSVTFGNVTHTARYRFNDDTAAMHTFFGNPASYSPTLVGSGISLITTAPGGEPDDQRYLDYSVNGQNTPVVSYQWVGVLSTTDDAFTTYSPFRRLRLENTAVDIHYPDGGATYHIALSSNANDYTVGGEANGAIDQIVAVVNTHTAQGHSAERVDAGFADTITNTKPVLRLDQTGTHALQNAPMITVVHPVDENSGTLTVARFADGGYNTIGRPGGLFNPNNYDTRAETDAKIAAIASTHGYAENIVPNAGNDTTDYTRLERLQVGTEIYEIEPEVSIKNQRVVNPNFVDNGDADGIHWEYDEESHTIQANLNHLPGAAFNNNLSYRTGDEVTFNNTIYIATKNLSSGTPPIDGGSSNNVFHGVGATPTEFSWRIAKAGIVIGGHNPTTDVFTDEVTAESIHFNTDHFELTPNLTAGDEDISLADGVFTRVGVNTVTPDSTITLADYEPDLVSYSNTTDNLIFFELPTEVTLDDNTTYTAEVTVGSIYTGVITFTGAQAVGGANLSISMDEATSVPQFDLDTDTAPITSGNSLVLTTIGDVTTYGGVRGDVVFAGDGVTQNGQTFTFTGGTGEGGSVRVDSVTVNNPNFIDDATASQTTRGVSFSADDDGNVSATISVVGIGQDAQVTADSIEAVASQVEANTWGIAQTGGLQTALDNKETDIPVQSAPPETPANGDKWLDSDDGSTYVYNGGNWIQIAGQGEQVPTSSGDDIELQGINAGSLVKVNEAQNNFVVAVAGEDYQDVLTAPQLATVNTDLTGYAPATWNAKQDALTAGTDYQAPGASITVNASNTLTFTGGITWRQEGNYLVGSVSSTDVVSIANDGHVRTTANYSVVANAAALTP